MLQIGSGDLTREKQLVIPVHRTTSVIVAAARLCHAVLVTAGCPDEAGRVDKSHKGRRQRLFGIRDNEAAPSLANQVLRVGLWEGRL